MACIMNIHDLYEGINKPYRRPICPVYAHTVYAHDFDLYGRYMQPIWSLYQAYMRIYDPYM